MRYRAIVAYDGTDFLGWQSQGARGRTVQETLRAAWSTVLRQPIVVEGAGRTDAGVHARGQVIAFDVEGGISDPDGAMRSVNAVLPADVAVREISPAVHDFDPRRHAVRRVYVYRIWNDRVRCPTRRRYAWHVPRPLDVGEMGVAAARLVGEQDFASFQGADKTPRPSFRRVERSGFRCEGSSVIYEIQANAFVRHMVRNIVGQLVEVGSGRCAIERFDEIVRSRDRRLAAPPAPPQGLCLERVDYA